MPRWLIPVGLLIGAGLVAIPRTAQATVRRRRLPSGPLTAEALAKQGYNDAQVKRILAVQPYVELYAKEFGVDPSLVNAVIRCESNFKTGAKSRVGASGLMQIMPRTAKGWGRELGMSGDVHDPSYNIRLGTYGLSKLLGKWNGDVSRALASYNWGIGNVRKKPDGPYPKETQNYIQCIKRHQVRFARAARA